MTCTYSIITVYNYKKIGSSKVNKEDPRSLTTKELFNDIVM